MTSLAELNIPMFVEITPRTLAQQVFKPILTQAIAYDRVGGSFSATWLAINSRGMYAFANHGGQARWILSPLYKKYEYDVLLSGSTEQATVILQAIVERELIKMVNIVKKDTLLSLAWMIADEVLTVKFALPDRAFRQHGFREQFSIFTDAEGNQVSFNAACMAARSSSNTNERMNMFLSWEPVLADIVMTDTQRFQKLWNNEDPNTKVFALPEAAHNRIIQRCIGARPYNEPVWIGMKRLQKTAAPYDGTQPTQPGSVALTRTQEQGIEDWIKRQCQGYLLAAPGLSDPTGDMGATQNMEGKALLSKDKILIALTAATRLYNIIAASPALLKEWSTEVHQQANEALGEGLAVIIIVPDQQLVDQWCQQAEKFGYQPLLIYKRRTIWAETLQRHVLKYNTGEKDCISVIATYNAFSTATFQEALALMKKASLLIVDGIESKQGYTQHPEKDIQRSAYVHAATDHQFLKILDEAGLIYHETFSMFLQSPSARETVIEQRSNISMVE